MRFIDMVRGAEDTFLYYFMESKYHYLRHYNYFDEIHSVEQIYQIMEQAPSDINKHVSTLREYGEQCNHITEFGVRHVCATWAFFISGASKIISYDIHMSPNMYLLYDVAEAEGIDWKFILGSSTKIKIDETDLLFIDTFHTYAQLKQELALNGNQAQKFIIFHDTSDFEFRDEGHPENKGIGLWPAIEEFMKENPHWIIEKRLTIGSGLTILKRT